MFFKWNLSHLTEKYNFSSYIVWRFTMQTIKKKLSSVLHDKVSLTDKTDTKHAATLLMLSLGIFLSLSKNTIDEALMITIISLCALRLRKKKYAHRSRWFREWVLKRGRKQSCSSSVFCEALKPHSVHAKRQICRPHITFCLIRLAWSCKTEDKTLCVDQPLIVYWRTLFRGPEEAGTNCLKKRRPTRPNFESGKLNHYFGLSLWSRGRGKWSNLSWQEGSKQVNFYPTIQHHIPVPTVRTWNQQSKALTLLADSVAKGR
jgi:hypothetical protein